MPESLSDEIAEAEASGLTWVEGGDALGLQRLAEAKERLIFVVRQDGLLVLAERLSGQVLAHHSVLAKGQPVLAAGEVELVWLDETKLVIELTNSSGHYMPGPESLDAAADAFRAVGFEVPDGAFAPYNEVY